MNIIQSKTGTDDIKWRAYSFPRAKKATNSTYSNMNLIDDNQNIWIWMDLSAIIYQQDFQKIWRTIDISC